MRRLLPFLFLAAILAAGCTRKVYVPFERHTASADTLRRTILLADTFSRIDSVIVFARGDTVVKEAWRIRDRIRRVADTVYLSRADTILRQVTLPAEKESKAAAGRRMWLPLLWIALGAAAALGIRRMLK